MTSNRISPSTAQGLENNAPRIAGEGAMWFFILGDLLIFGVYFVVYAGYREMDSSGFLERQQTLNQGLGVLNTLVLLTSSLFVALATEAARKQAREAALKLFGIAFVTGVLFPLLKAFEWIPKLAAGQTAGEHLFYTFYFIMTGLHLGHVLLGLAILGFVMREIKQQQTPNIEFVETGAVYWHMVDLLWIVLFALFYLMR